MFRLLTRHNVDTSQNWQQYLPLISTLNETPNLLNYRIYLSFPRFEINRYYVSKYCRLGDSCTVGILQVFVHY
jgi:hypothetical protein